MSWETSLFSVFWRCILFSFFIFQKQKAVYSWNVHESQCKLSLIYKKDGLLMFGTNLNNEQIVWLGKKNVNSLSVGLETGRFSGLP